MEEFKQELPQESEEESEVNILDNIHEPQLKEEVLLDAFPIAGFWKRITAIIIDGLVIAIPLLIFGFTFRSFAYSLGLWGRLIGYTLAFIYWGYYNSERKSGQTIGKRARKIAVVNENGDFLSLRTSFIRASIIAAIGLLNGWALSIFQNPILSFAQTVIVFGGGMTLMYGLIFNRTTRQGVHDLIIGSYVVTVPFNEPQPPIKLPAIHRNIMIGLISLGAIVGITGSSFNIYNAADRKPFVGISEESSNLQELYNKITAQGDFVTVGVQHITRRSGNSAATLEDINIDIWAKEPCSRVTDNCDELINQIAQIVLNEYDQIDDLTGMKITIVNRFDFGLATGNSYMGAQLRIEDWYSRLEESVN